MSDESLRINYKNFTPSFEDKATVLSSMRDIEYAAPSDSTITLDMKKTWAGYFAQCRVVSGVGVFSAHHETNDFHGVINRVEHQINEQLSAWKATRFATNNPLRQPLTTAS